MSGPRATFFWVLSWVVWSLRAFPAAARALEQRCLSPSDQSVRAVFAPVAGKLDLSNGYLPDRTLEAVLDGLYGTPNFVVMDDEEFDREMEKMGLSVRVSA